RTRSRAIVGIIEPCDLKPWLHILGQPSQPTVRSLGASAKGDAPLWPVPHNDAAFLAIKVSRIRLQQMTSDLQCLLLQRASCQDCRPAGEHSTAARVGPGTVWRQGCVTTDDTHILEWDTQRVSDHLSESSFMALPLRGNAKGCCHCARRVYPDEGGLSPGGDWHAG